MKSFFQNKLVKILSWILFALSIVSLVFGGVTKENVDSFVVLVFAVIAGVSALVAFIAGIVNNTDS